MKIVKQLTLFVLSYLLSNFSSAATMTAPVMGFTRDFVTNQPITDATLTIVESGQLIKTDNKGNFGPIDWPIGQPITFTLTKIGYRTTQSATVTVPEAGLTTPYTMISLQPVDIFSFYSLATIMGKTLDENKCHVAITITAYHKTLNDLPQGEIGSVISLNPIPTETPYYFDIYTNGPLKNYPNPFTKGLTETSADGGVIFANLEPSDKPYVATAIKPNVSFTQTSFICRKGTFVNISPPQGPMAES